MRLVFFSHQDYKTENEQYAVQNTKMERENIFSNMRNPKIKSDKNKLGNGESGCKIKFLKKSEKCVENKYG